MPKSNTNTKPSDAIVEEQTVSNEAVEETSNEVIVPVAEPVKVPDEAQFHEDLRTIPNSQAVSVATSALPDINQFVVDPNGPYKTKSACIRAMDAVGYSRSAIAKHMGIIYQHVRNVLVVVPKKGATPTAPQAATQAASEGEGESESSEVELAA